MSDPIIAVMVGCGAMSKTWLTGARGIPGVDVFGFVDLNVEAARARAAEFGSEGAVTGTNLADVLDLVRPQVVFDCTVPAAHADVTITALRRGCHVLGEKPIADSLANARRMIDVARETGRLYAVIQNYRYHRSIRRLKAFLDSGAIGAITTINADFYIGAHFGGFRDAMPHVLLLDMAIHTFDAARFLCGRQPRAVYCHEFNPAHSWYAHAASASAIFEMDGGVVFTYRGSWCADGLQTPWNSEWRIIGERGSVSWDGGEGFRAEVIARPGGFRTEYAAIDVPEVSGLGAKGNGHAGVIEEFIDCVRNGGTPETICSDNIHSFAMVMAAIASAEQKQRVALDA